MTAVKMQGVILNRNGAKVKNLSKAAVTERFFGPGPQNDKPVQSVWQITSSALPYRHFSFQDALLP